MLVEIMTGIGPVAVRQPRLHTKATRALQEIWAASCRRSNLGPAIGCFGARFVVRGDDLAADQHLAGPAIIEALDSTIVVPPGWIAGSRPLFFFKTRSLANFRRPDRGPRVRTRLAAGGGSLLRTRLEK